jgi:hypothetical protein
LEQMGLWEIGMGLTGMRQTSEGGIS